MSIYFINFDLHSFKDATCQDWLNLVKGLKIRKGKCEKYTKDNR